VTSPRMQTPRRGTERMHTNRAALRNSSTHAAWPVRRGISASTAAILRSGRRRVACHTGVTRGDASSAVLTSRGEHWAFCLHGMHVLRCHTVRARVPPLTGFKPEHFWSLRHRLRVQYARTAGNMLDGVGPASRPWLVSRCGHRRQVSRRMRTPHASAPAIDTDRAAAQRAALLHPSSMGGAMPRRCWWETYIDRGIAPTRGAHPDFNLQFQTW